MAFLGYLSPQSFGLALPEQPNNVLAFQGSRNLNLKKRAVSAGTQNALAWVKEVGQPTYSSLVKAERKDSHLSLGSALTE